MGQLVPAGASALAAYGGVNPWAEAARGVETGAYLKFNGNDGIYSFGQDDDELPEGSRIIVDMETLALGWTCWVDSEVEEEILVPVVDGKPPQEHLLTDHGPYNQDDGWRSSASISCVIDSYGKDDRDEAVGMRLLWKTSTSGQVRSIQKLSGAYGRVFSQHEGEFPIIEIGVDSYAPKNKKHGKVKYSPNLKIVGWITAAELDGMVGSADKSDDYDDEPESAPARTKREAPVEEEAAPARGRRAAPAAEEEEAPAPRSRRAAPVEAEEEEAPATRGRRAAPAAEPEEEEAPAPRSRRAAPVEAEEEEAPAPRSRRAAPVQEEEESAPRRRGAPREEEGDEAEAPAPRGRSAGRGDPPANARLRKFD